MTARIAKSVVRVLLRAACRYAWTLGLKREHVATARAVCSMVEHATREL